MFASARIHTVLVATILAATGLGAATALGQPFDPPDWWGAANGQTVTLGFTFDDQADPMNPDQSQVPSWYGGTTTTFEGDVGWHEEIGGRQGVIGLDGGGQSGSLTVRVDNLYCEPSVKKVWLQFDSYCNQAGIAWGLRVPSGQNGSTRTQTSRDVERLPDGWVRHTYEYEIDPQPAWEEFHCRFATADSGGQCAIDNLSISTECELEQPDGDDLGFGFDFPVPEWPPYPTFENDPNWFYPPGWDRYGAEPDWLPGLTDHEGVWGLPGGEYPEDGGLVMEWSVQPQPEGERYIHYEFDFYMAEGGGVYWEEMVSPGSYIESQQESIEELDNGWMRARLDLVVSPPPAWHQISWHMFTEGGRGGPVAIDNVTASTSSEPPRFVRVKPQMLEVVDAGAPPVPLQPVPSWREKFDRYVVGTQMHGQNGWKGWDNDVAFGAEVTDAQARSGSNSVDIVADSDLVREFSGHDSGNWAFTTWQYIPSDFVGGAGGEIPGSFFVIMNTYADGGPHEEPNWSVQMNFDSNDGMLKVYYGNGMNTVDVPYVPDAWVEINIKIDLDIDLCTVYYDGAYIVEYPWTGGVTGVGGGALNIAAVDLYANGSTSIYYDNLSLKPASGP